MQAAKSNIELEVGAVNQLMAAQSMLYVLLSEVKLGEFVYQALKNVPAVDRCSICIRGAGQVIGDFSKEAEKIIEAMRKISEDQDHLSLTLPVSENLMIFMLQTSERTYGYLLLFVKTNPMFENLKSAVNNFINVVAVDLERRRQKAELEKSHTNLEIQVEMRTADLEAEITERKRVEEDLEDLNKQLQATVEKLTLANRELQHFAHIAAHDLKAPLRAIGTLADWISTDYADKFDEEGKREVELLVGRVARMSDMIDSILRYSEAGRVIKEKEKVNLNALIEEVMAGIAPPENISVTVENELPVLEGEKTHFMQVFQNLLSNAVKYMDKPIGQIKVGCTEENGFWKFSVADNGPGIEKEYFERIFEMFQTLLPRDEFETTGIGLSIVKKIVETYGGRVWIESEVGKGSVFFFTLPNQEMKVADDAKLKANIVS